MCKVNGNLEVVIKEYVRDWKQTLESCTESEDLMELLEKRASTPQMIREALDSIRSGEIEPEEVIARLEEYLKGLSVKDLSKELSDGPWCPSASKWFITYKVPADVECFANDTCKDCWFKALSYIE